MIPDYLVLDGTEIVNHARLEAYRAAGLVGSFDSLDICGCPALTAEALEETYTSPEADPAPWYDPTVPASAEFSGLWVLSIAGHDSRPTGRSVTQTVTGGGVFGRQRVTPRTIVVTGVLLGSSCCGVDYGLKWLGQVLDTCEGVGCDGVDAEVIGCCPSEDVGSGDLLATYGRTMRRVALTQGPTVTRRAGDGCQGGCTADVMFVEFILTAAEPWMWSPAVEVLEEFVPTDDGADCVTWTVVAEGEGCGTEEACCRLATCDTGTDCADPECATPTPPTVASPTSCFCLPIAVNRTCHSIDTSEVPASFDALPIITVNAGYSDLRRLTISFYENDGSDCCTVADASRCDPVAVYHVGYIPAGAEMTFDGQIRRVLVDCGEGSEQASDAWGRNGAPVSFVPLGCDREYCVTLEADAIFTPADDATVTIALSNREV